MSESEQAFVVTGGFSLLAALKLRTFPCAWLSVWIQAVGPRTHPASGLLALVLALLGLTGRCGVRVWLP